MFVPLMESVYLWTFYYVYVCHSTGQRFLSLWNLQSIGSGMYVVGSKQTLNTEEAHMPMQVDVRDTSSVPGLGRSPGGGQPIPVFLAGESHGQRSLVGLPSIGTQSWTRLK